MKVTIYHNPRCSKSREALALLVQHGITPDIIKYLETPPSEDQLVRLLAMLQLSPAALLRKKEAPYKQAGLDRSAVTDADIIAAMAAHPILIERPIVIAGDRAVLGRPPENILSIIS